MESYFHYNDGGRSDSGYIGEARDCVARSVAIAAGLPYQDVYSELAKGNAKQRVSINDLGYIPKRRVRTARNGINTKRKWFKDYMISLGFTWTPTMQIGSGCTVHLTPSELPAHGRLVLSLSKHCAAFIDGKLLDTYDCSRDGTRCVYGYWTLT